MSDATAVTEEFGPVAQARQRPDVLALIDGERAVTYAEFGERCGRVAAALRDLGVGVGDRVAVMLPNSVEWFEAAHGAGRIGAITVPVNTHFKADEATHVVRDAGSSAVIVHAQLLDAVAPIDDLPFLVVGTPAAG